MLMRGMPGRDGIARLNREALPVRRESGHGTSLDLAADPPRQRAVGDAPRSG
jgi:hypothetical protein